MLKNVRRLQDGLSLVIDYKGVDCMAAVMLGFSEDTLILLRQILLQRFGEPIALIEDLDINLQGAFPIVK